MCFFWLLAVSACCNGHHLFCFVFIFTFVFASCTFVCCQLSCWAHCFHLHLAVDTIILHSLNGVRHVVWLLAIHFHLVSHGACSPWSSSGSPAGCPSSTSQHLLKVMTDNLIICVGKLCFWPSSQCEICQFLGQIAKV